MKVIYDISTLQVLYKTGIPTYVLELATALRLRGVDLLPSIHERFFPSQKMDQILFESRLRLDSEVSGGTRFSTGLLNRVKSRIARIKFIHNALKNSRLKKSLYIQKIEKASAQHILAHSITYPLIDLPLIYTLHDMSVFAHPEAHAEINIRVFKTAMDFLAKWISKKRPLRIIADSESTRLEIKKYLGADFYERSETILLACNREIFKPRSQTVSSQEKYILSVGTLEPRKNLARLLESFDTLGKNNPDLYLYLVGAPGWKNKGLDETIARHNFSNRIRLLGYVSGTSLVKLYQNAAVFCYPSLYEGFGLPVLEAMSCGAPVVISNSTSLPEVGGKAALYFDPFSTNHLTDQLETALLNKEVLAEKSLEQSNKFSWARTAELTEKIYLMKF